VGVLNRKFVELPILTQGCGKWKREEGTKGKTDPSTSIPSFLRAGGMTGLGKRREEFEI
jgi:hypothetical protein